jgi:hypothetical protein
VPFADPFRRRLVLSFPLTAVFNLFVHVLQHPTLATTDSDINLMYTAAGHYSYLEFLSPDQKFPFVRELANVARKVASEAKVNLRSKLMSTINSPGLSTTSGLQSLGEPVGTGPLLYDVSITFDWVYEILAKHLTRRFN